jgi:hypothetical protein
VNLIAACVLIQAEAGPAAIAAAALRDLPGVSDPPRLAGPCGVIARAQARDTGELAEPGASRVRAPGGVSRTMSCPVVRR